MQTTLKRRIVDWSLSGFVVLVTILVFKANLARGEWQVSRVYAVLDNLNVHTACDALLFSLAHPRWGFVFQPKYAAYLNLIEPWWKVLRSLALKGRRFATWEKVGQAISAATQY